MWREYIHFGIELPLYSHCLIMNLTKNKILQELYQLLGFTCFSSFCGGEMEE